MLGEVISIGDELTSGQRLDTNSQWLSERLGELGVRVMFHTVVADDLDANVLVFKQAIERADLVIATGGLGPTADDLTREAIARTTGAELVLNDAALEHIRSLFSRRKRDMPERNRVQAYFPAGSRVIPNPDGTAPGIDIDVLRAGRDPSRIFALPGVPAEMRQMWAESVAPAIRDLGAGSVIRHRRLKCFGTGESQLEQMLPDLIRRGRSPQVGITVSGATITLRITAAGPTPEACEAAMEPTAATIRECLGDLVFGEEDDELEHAVLRLLAERGQTLGTAEWGTGGIIAHWLNAVAGHDRSYLGGLVVSTAKALAGLFDIPSQASSKDATAAMAEICRARLQADFGLAVSQFPAVDPAAIEPGLFHIALASANGTIALDCPFVGHPSILKPLSAKRSLNLLRLRLLKQ